MTKTEFNQKIKDGVITVLMQCMTANSKKMYYYHIYGELHSKINTIVF